MSDHDPLPLCETNRFPIPADRAMSYSYNEELFATNCGDRLRASIEALYATFADIQIAKDFALCPHCFTNDDAGYLRNTPLRELTFRDTASIPPTRTHAWSQRNCSL